MSAWRDLRGVLAGALDREGAERAAFLRGACGGDARLASEVASLLAGDAVDDDDLLAPAMRLRAGLAAAGAGIGRYRIVRAIGAGGMGTVFEAEQQEPRRRVALKILHLAGGSDAALRRFRREAELLARLEHPGIARIHEAGTHVATLGGAPLSIPFIAMEFVAGARDLLRYAEDEALDRAARVRLFAEVCDAVGFGHARGVVHRDLKPGNVLVDADGRPRVIDFGIARAIGGAAEAAGATRSGELLGTLECMSPEQLAGDRDATAASDVYALGVLLHRLLLGRPPFAATGLAGAMRARLDAPARPTRLDATLPGDFDWILAKALDPAPQRRYASADALASDLRRHLARLPIEARPPARLHRAGRFVARHRLLAALAAALVVALSSGLVATGLGWRAARAAERASAARAKETAEVAEFLGQVFAIASPRDGRRDATVRESLERAAPSIDDRFAAVVSARRTLHLRFANVFSDLGDADRAAWHFERAIAADDADAAKLDAARRGLALARLDQGRAGEALALAQALRPDGAPIRDEPDAVAADVLGRCLRAAGRFDESVAAHRRAVAAAEALALRPEARALLASSLVVALRQAGHADEAIALIRRSPYVGDAALPAEDESRADALDEWGNLATALVDAGALADAEAIERRVVPRLREVLGADHPRTVTAIASLAAILSRAGKPADAEALWTEALAAMPADGASQRRALALARTSQARCREQLGRHAEAEAAARLALDEGVALGDDTIVCEAALVLGPALGEQGRFAEAAEVLGAQRPRIERVRGATSKAAMINRYNEARMLASCGRRTESRARLVELLADPAIDGETRTRAEQGLAQLDAIR